MFQHLTKFRVLSSGGKKLPKMFALIQKFRSKQHFLTILTGSDWMEENTPISDMFGPQSKTKKHCTCQYFIRTQKPVQGFMLGMLSYKHSEGLRNATNLECSFTRNGVPKTNSKTLVFAYLKVFVLSGLLHKPSERPLAEPAFSIKSKRSTDPSCFSVSAWRVARILHLPIFTEYMHGIALDQN